MPVAFVLLNLEQNIYFTNRLISVMYAEVFKWQIIQKHVPTGISPTLPWGALSLVSHYPIFAVPPSLPNFFRLAFTLLGI